MIIVEEAIEILSDQVIHFGTEQIPSTQAIGRVLREQVVADRDFPPFDRVTMDGIAIHYATFEQGVRTFDVTGEAPAGTAQAQLDQPKNCLEVMTGAVLPKGTDTVIRYEDVIIEDGRATIQIDAINFRQNVHFQGIDRKQGDGILQPGIVLGAAQLGVCATVGQEPITVSRLPKTLIISTGDELVEVDETPLPHQIRKSNIAQLSALLDDFRIVPDKLHLQDDYEHILDQLKDCVNTYDLILLSGGVSKGKYDFLPRALDELGVHKWFHKIKQRPGKPFWFGRKEDCFVFAFPGNPVSSFMCATRYLRPWLAECLQQQMTSPVFVRLSEDVYFKPDLTYFLEVKLRSNLQGVLEAHPVKGNGSGDLANLVDADAFIQLPQGRDVYEAGGIYPVFRY